MRTNGTKTGSYQVIDKSALSKVMVFDVCHRQIFARSCFFVSLFIAD